MGTGPLPARRVLFPTPDPLSPPSSSPPYIKRTKLPHRALVLSHPFIILTTDNQSTTYLAFTLRSHAPRCVVALCTTLTSTCLRQVSFEPRCTSLLRGPQALTSWVDSPCTGHVKDGHSCPAFTVTHQSLAAPVSCSIMKQECLPGDAR